MCVEQFFPLDHLFYAVFPVLLSDSVYSDRTLKFSLFFRSSYILPCNIILSLTIFFFYYWFTSPLKCLAQICLYPQSTGPGDYA